MDTAMNWNPCLCIKKVCAHCSRITLKVNDKKNACIVLYAKLCIN